MSKLGLYIHIPFCKSKCHYCDFYSLPSSEEHMDRYTAALMQHLQEKGIACAIYYPVPLHEQKAYQDPRYKKGDFPVSEYLCENVIALPMHTEFTDEKLEYVTKTILDFIA